MMDLPKSLKDEIWNYCRVNDITNIDDFIIKMVKRGFNIEKYGAEPSVAVPAEQSTSKVEEAPEPIKEVIETPVKVEKVKKDIYGED